MTKFQHTATQIVVRSCRATHPSSCASRQTSSARSLDSDEDRSTSIRVPGASTAAEDCTDDEGEDASSDVADVNGAAVDEDGGDHATGVLCGVEDEARNGRKSVPVVTTIAPRRSASQDDSTEPEAPTCVEPSLQ